MSEPAVEPPVVPSNEAPPVENAAPWADYLTELPDSVKPLVEPLFKKWDGDVTQRFQTVHSEYEPLKPFQEIVNNGWEFNDVQQALILAQTLNDNPEAVYKALVEAYKFGETGTGPVGEPVNPPDDGTTGGTITDPEFLRIKEMTEAMAQLLTQQQQQAEAAQQDAQLNATIADLKQKYGEFDDQYVMTKVYAGSTWDQAVADFQQLIASHAANRVEPPVIMGSGGGLPSQVVTPGSMSDKDRKSLVTQLLAQAAQQQT